jgi:hypothetical protein
MRTLVTAAIFLLVLAPAAPGQKYSGPRPPKPDVPFLLHADNLVPTEAAEAKEEQVKNDLVYSISGAESSAKTPLASPVFIIETDKLAPDKLELYRLEVKNGRRQVSFSKKRQKDSSRAIRTILNRLDDNLYRLEVQQSLENGEYSLTPSGSNQVFCFQVF